MVVETMVVLWEVVLFTSRLEPSPDLGSSRLGSWHPGLEARATKKPPRTAKRLESPRGSSRLVDPCSSHQELGAKRLEPTRVESRAGFEPARARGTPGLEGLESARLVHNTSGKCSFTGEVLRMARKRTRELVGFGK